MVALAGKNVVWIGDSHSEPGSISLKHAMEPFFAREGARVIRWAGRRGWSTGCYLDGRPCPRSATRTDDVPGLVQNADIVFIELGANDNPGRGYADGIRRWLSTVRATEPSAEIVWIGPPAAVADGVRERHDDVAERLRGIVRGEGARFIDSRPFTTSGHARDGVHFTRPAYEHWAGQLQAAIRRGRSTGAGARAGGGWLVPVAIGLGVAGAFVLWQSSKRRHVYAAA